MPRLILPSLLVHLCLIGFPVLGKDPALSNQTLVSLQARISSHISQPRFAGAVWGIKIASLKSGAVLYESNAHKLLKPASNAKLFTGALALDRLGPDYRIKTSIYQTGRRPAPEKLEGNLIIYGRGDPSFAARFHRGKHQESLESLVDAILATGLREVRGQLIADETYFTGPPFGAGWVWDDLQYNYGAEISALCLEDNVLDLWFSPGQSLGDPGRLTVNPGTDYLAFFNQTRTTTPDKKPQIEIYRPVGSTNVYLSGELPLHSSGSYTGSVTVPRPAAFFITHLQKALEHRGLRVAGGSRAISQIELQSSPEFARSERQEIASVYSPPLGEIVARMMKPSQNLYAQLLLWQIGALSNAPALLKASFLTGNGPAPNIYETNLPTTEEAGLSELKKFLQKIGIKDGDVLLEEGSGLSRSCLVKPNAIVELLQFMNRHPHRQAFRDALPLAGVDGTLQSRMRGTAAAGKVRAKTGSLRYTNTLAGYITTALQEELVFSLILNNFYDPQGSARRDLDAIVVMLAEFTGTDRFP